MKNFLKNRIKNFLILLSILTFLLPFDFVNSQTGSLYHTHIMEEIVKKRDNKSIFEGYTANTSIIWINDPNNYEKYSTSFFDIYYLKNISYKYYYGSIHDNRSIEGPIEKTADKIKFYSNASLFYWYNTLVWCYYDGSWEESSCNEYLDNPNISLEDKKERLKTEILDVFAKIWINPRIIDVGDEFDVFIEFEDDSIIVLRSNYFTSPILHKKLILPPKSVKVANKNSITSEEILKVLQKIKEANPDFNFWYDSSYYFNNNYNIPYRYQEIFSNFKNVSPKEVWQNFKKHWFYSFYFYSGRYCAHWYSLSFSKYWFNDIFYWFGIDTMDYSGKDNILLWYGGPYFFNDDGGGEFTTCLNYEDMLYEEEPENTENTNPENLDNTNIENNNQNSENPTENITNNSSTENNQNNSSSFSNSWHGWYTPWIPTISNNNFENLEISNILNSAPQNPQNSNIILSDKIENKTNIIFDLEENTENSNSNYILSTFADNWNIEIPEIPENPISDNKNTENKNPKFIQNSKIILPDYLPATWFEIIFVLIFSILSSFLIFRKNLKN